MQNCSITPKDVHLHCRCCLGKFADGSSINTSDLPRPLFQLFRYCTGYRMWQKGLYPEFMCPQCLEMLKSFEKFEKMCKQSSCILEELLNGQRVKTQVSSESLQYTKSEETFDATKQIKSTCNELAPLTPISTNKDVFKNNCSFENINVKPEIENVHNSTDDYHHEESDLDDSSALAELEDAEVKSEASVLDAGTSKLSDKTYSVQINSEVSNLPKKRNKSELHCEHCADAFKTKSKLKQHVKEMHEDKVPKVSEKIRRTRMNRRSNDFEATLEEVETNFPPKTMSPHLMTLDTEMAEINSSAFESIVVKEILESSTLNDQQSSDSDFEDSLALTELRKSAIKSKAKKAAHHKKQNEISSPLHSENETFGPLKIEKPKVVCDKCPRKFKWPFELRRHITEMHGDKPLELPCKYDCGKVFNSQNTLKSHYRIKHQMKKQIYRENAYICEQCGKGFKRLPLLERHRFHHLPPSARPYKCDQCGKAFVMERIYKEHLLRHSGNKKFECSYCGIKKATLGEYKEHINIHTKEKEYACELCPKIFYRSKNLVQHVSAVHQGIKKHFCRFCQHSFANHINLIHHERIHTGEKPYSCEVCQRSFIQPSALKTHMKIHDESRVKAKVGRKPKNSKAKEDFGGFETIIDNNLQQQINNYNE